MPTLAISSNLHSEKTLTPWNIRRKPRSPQPRHTAGAASWHEPARRPTRRKGRRGVGLAFVLVAAGAPTPLLAAPQPYQTPAAVPAPDRPPVPGAPAGVTAFVDVAVVPMDTDRVLPHQTVLIRGGRIAALGPVDSVTIPQGAVRIDGQDKYLMPGLGTCHGHVTSSLGYGTPSGDPRYSQLPLLLLLNDGITVLRNVDYQERDSRLPGTWLNGRDLLRAREQAAAGQVWSPRLYIAGQWAPIQYLVPEDFAEQQGYPTPRPAPRLDSVAAYVAAYQAAGYDFIKLHDEPPAVMDSVFAAARRVGIQVGGHMVHGFGPALAGGQKVGDHTFWGWPEEGYSQDRVQLAANAGARRRAGIWTCIGGYFDKDSLILHALHDSAAGFFLLGADGSSGLSDLPRMVKDAGLTPYQVLVGATKNFAQYARTLDPHGDEIGTIAVGQRADLLLLTGNPLADIRYVVNDTAELNITGRIEHYQPLAQTSPVLVMIGGRWLLRPELNRRVAVVSQYLKLIQEEWRRKQRYEPVDRPDSLQQAERLALVTRFALAAAAPAGGADSLRGAQLLVELFARQLGAARAALPAAAARDSFDEYARAWLARRAENGYQVAIPGVSP